MLSWIRFSSSGRHSQTQLSDLATHPREFCQQVSPQKREGAGNAGRRSARSRAWCVVSTRVSHRGHTGNARHSPRNGFNGFLRALPGDRALLSPSPARRVRPLGLTSPFANLTPASRRQDHTTSPSASGALVRSAIRVHRIRLTSVTIAKRPSGRQDGMGYATDLGRARNGKFFDGGLDDPNHLDPLQQNSVLRKSPAGRPFPGEKLTD
jgi:hypothetical protein